MTSSQYLHTKLRFGKLSCIYSIFIMNWESTAMSFGEILNLLLLFFLYKVINRMLEYIEWTRNGWLFVLAKTFAVWGLQCTRAVNEPPAQQPHIVMLIDRSCHKGQAFLSICHSLFFMECQVWCPSCRLSVQMSI